MMDELSRAAMVTARNAGNRPRRLTALKKRRHASLADVEASRGGPEVARVKCSSARNHVPATWRHTQATTHLGGASGCPQACSCPFRAADCSGTGARSIFGPSGNV